MIAALRGMLMDKRLDSMVVDVNGVGYLVFASAQTLANLPGEGREISLHCHTHVREDAIQVFGFSSPQEQQAFELLITVSGVGPKLALTTLSGMAVDELLSAIAGADHKRLQSIPGIGRKTAERIVVDLKESCVKLLPQVTSRVDAAAPAAAWQDEVVGALVNLGYKRALAQKAVSEALKHEVEGPEVLLRQALQSMAELTNG